MYCTLACSLLTEICRGNLNIMCFTDASYYVKMIICILYYKSEREQSGRKIGWAGAERWAGGRGRGSEQRAGVTKMGLSGEVVGLKSSNPLEWQASLQLMHFDDSPH